MKSFIYFIQLLPKYRNPAAWQEAENAAIQAHFNYLKKAHEDGIATFVGRTDLEITEDKNKGLVVFQAENEDAAKAFMENDPAIRFPLMEGELLPFRVVF